MQRGWQDKQWIWAQLGARGSAVQLGGEGVLPAPGNIQHEKGGVTLAFLSIYKHVWILLE
jgi:hypothetical protein